MIPPVYFPLSQIHHRLGKLIILILLLASISSHAQTIRYVKPSPSGSGDGSSWANATSDLQATINSLSITGGQVWVANGLYKPTTNISYPYSDSRNVSFVMKSKVAIYGSFSGRENSLSDRVLSYPSSTTLSGNLGDESTDADNSYHVVYASSVDSTALLDGFVITGGNGNGSFSNSTSVGGGLYSGGSNIRLNNCFFINNYALTWGGALTINYTYSSNNSAILTNCLFQDNSSGDLGGAIFVATSDYSGYTNRLTLSNCSFQTNRANKYGGGIALSSSGAQVYANLINCSFQGNMGGQGAAISVIAHSTDDKIQMRLQSCVVFGNGGANSFYSGYSFYGSTAPFISGRYSLFEQSATGYTSDNTDQTTLFSPFASLTSTQLAPCSPAINAGDPNTTTYQVGVTDLIGNTRFVGNLDMGPYEFQTNPCPPESQEFFSTQTGRWDDPATWSTGRLPTSSDVVHLKHAVTIPQNYVANARKLRIEPVARLVYETGGRLQLNP